MRRSTTVVIALAWGVGLGGTFGCLLPYLLGYWQARQPLPLWPLAQLAGGLLIVLGLVPIVWAFADFVRAGGTPVPAAAPPHLVVTGLYRHVRNPIYAGFLLLLLGQALVFGSLGLLLYAGVAWCIAALVVRFFEQPRLLRRFGADYEDYLRTVPAWIPGLRPVPPRAIAAPRPRGGAGAAAETAGPAVRARHDRRGARRAGAARRAHSRGDRDAAARPSAPPPRQPRPTR